VEGRRIALKKPDVKVPALAVPVVAVPAKGAAGANAAAGGGATSGAAAPSETFTIRVGTYASDADAKAVVARLAARKLDATVESRTTSEGTSFFVVFAGRYTNRDEASKMAATLAEEERLDTAVVPSSNL